MNLNGRYNFTERKLSRMRGYVLEDNKVFSSQINNSPSDFSE